MNNDLEKLCFDCPKSSCCCIQYTIFSLPKEKKILKDANKKCEYLGENNKCRQYKKRPVDCQTYPVTFIVDEKKNIIFCVDNNCPAVQKNLITKPYVEKAIKLWKKNLKNVPDEWLISYSNDVKKYLSAIPIKISP